jgi:RNA polymerase sigma-70 factor (ECF subfamily)
MVEAQLAEWLEEGYVPSFRTACLILGNRADAEEAVQEAFLRAWRFRDSLADVPSIRPWLYRVVVNSCYSKLRREIPHRDRRAGAEPLADVAAEGVGPEASAEHGEVADTVLAALARLPLSLRVPVVLRYYADLSERDIARAIGRRQGTVKSRLHEARRRLATDPALSALAFIGEDADMQAGTDAGLGAVAGEEAGS